MKESTVNQHDYTFQLALLVFLASIIIPTQFIKIDGKWDNLPKLLPPLAGLILSIEIIRNTKHEPTEREKDISQRYEGLDVREEQLNERETRILNAEKTAKSERDRKQAELNSKIQSINESEAELRKRLESINQLIDDRAEIMAEKLNNSYIERERELEAQYQQKHSELMEWYDGQLKKLNNYKFELEKNILEARTEFNLEVTKYERKILELELTIKKLNQRIRDLKAPRLATGGDEIACHECNKVISFLWRHEPPIQVDAEPLATPIETGERETRFWLRLRDPLQFPLLKSEKVANGIRFEVGKNTSPIIQQEDSTDLVRITLPWNSKAPKPEELNRKSVEETLKSILDVGADRSWLITGHPGAGKTSTLIYLGQQLGGKDAVRIALNPHQDDYSSYSQYGFLEINELSEIFNYCLLLKAELELRRKDKNRRFKLVVVVDELGAILDAGDASEIMAIFRQLAVEGRKLGLVVLIGNHSQTTKAISMDSEFRSAFYQLFLVGAARYAVEQPHRNTGLSKLEENYIKSAAYPALMLANMQYSLVKHPTHGDYKQYRDKGNLPRNLEQWESNIDSTELGKLLGNATYNLVTNSGVTQGNEGLTVEKVTSSVTLKKLANNDVAELDIFPGMTESERFDYWLKIKELVDKYGKAYVIKETLNCKGKNYQKGCDYLNFLDQKCR